MRKPTADLVRLTAIVSVCFALLCTPAAAQAPTITSISPTSGVVGMQVRITGIGFGENQGTSMIALDGTNATATNWSDTSIGVIVPTGAASGPFSVTVGGQTANSAPFTVAALPSVWSDSDVGEVGTVGSASYAGGVFTVSGAGNQIYGTADGFHFAYQVLSGDGSIVARVMSVQGASGWASVGPMIRETLAGGSTNVKLADWPPYHSFYLDLRTTTNGSTNEPASIIATPPYWVKLVRSGSTFSSYGSTDGVNWTQVGSGQTVSMAENVYVGLAVDSGSTSSLATAAFDNVSVNSSGSPGPVITGVSATTGNVGSQVVISGSGFGAAQGGSVATLNAVPVTIDSWSDTSITTTIPAGATTGFLVVSVAPSMNDSNPVVFTVTSQPLPSGWLDGDVGVVGIEGSATYAGGVFTVSGAGNQIYGTADGFHFAYQTLSGDGSIVARVTNVQGASGWAAVGPIIRETLSAGSTNVKLADWPQFHSFYLDLRPTTNGSTDEPANIIATPPYWAKLVRSGSTFSSYGSTDGVNWTQVGSSQTVSMAQNAYVGLAVDSGSTSSLATATFDNVSINSSAAPAPVITGVSATTGSVGSQVVIGGTGFGAAQSGSVVMLNAVPVTINFWSDTSITTTIPAGATTGLLVVSVAPSMNDSNAVVFTVTSQPLPSGWLDGDVGVVGIEGSATYASGVFTVSGAGRGVDGGSADSFHFAYQPLSGDGSIVARVASVGSGATAGVMVRETLDTGSTNANTVEWVPSSALLEFDVRATTGGNTSLVNEVWTTLPYWVKVIRSGSTFSSYGSTDGVNWMQQGSSQTISMATNVDVGLVVENGSTSSLATATFDNVWTSFGALTSNPSITGLSPNTGVPGTSVTITGANFGSTQGASRVAFNGTVATPTNWSATSIAAPVPLGATSGNIVVTVGGVASNGVPFTVSQTPTVNSLSPTSGPAGTSVTISGVNFGSSPGTSTVTFNGTAATPTTWNATTIVVPVPNGATTGNVVVTTPNGTASGVPFTVFQLPSISSLSTASATIGSLVTITGTNFGAVQGASSVTFNGVAGMPASWASTSIALPVPEGATTGNVVVTVNGLASNAVPVTIVTLSLPPVAQVLPANGANGVPENGRVIVRFAQPVQPTAIITGTLAVSQGATNITGSLALSNDGLSVTFTPSQNLSANASFSVVVTDLAGNQTIPEFQSNFATGSATDTVAPTIMQTSPQNNNTGVPISAPIVLQFSKGMDPATLTPQSFTVSDWVTGKPVPGMVQVDASGTTASFVPQSFLGVDRTFSVSLSSTIEDSSGNSLTGATYFSFTTSFAADTTAPQVVGMSPANGASGLPLNALIVLQFNKALNAISVSNGLHVESGGQPTSGAIALSSSNQQVTFTPLGGLAPNTTYSVITTAQITDVGGFALANPGSFSMTTGTANDTTTPSVVGVSPGNQSTGVPTNGVVQLQFSKAVDPLTVTSSTFQVSTYGVGILQSGTVSVSADGLTATFIPTGLMNSYTRYYLRATDGIADWEGHALSSFGSYFTTGGAADSSSPMVQMISPANGTSGIPVNLRLDVVVSTPLNPASVSSNAIVLSAGGTAVAGTVSLSSDGMTLTFVPSNLLATSTTYSVSVGGVTDQSGNELATFTSTFTTGASSVANTTQPLVLSANPANGATGVSVNDPVVLTFNEPIDATTVSGTSAPISVSGLSGVLSGSYAVDSTGTLVTFTPLSPLPANATIVVQVNSGGVLDLSGNGSNSYYGTFSTGIGVDATAPAVILVTPANAATGVTLNTPVTLTFSKSLNRNTINATNLGVLVNGVAQPIGISTSADNRVVTIDAYGFPGSSSVAVLATDGLTDIYGNPLANFQSQFTTGPAPTGTAPTLVSQHPGNGATGVPVNDSIALYFSQPMNVASLTAALYVAQNGVLVSGTTQVTDNGQVVQFTPAAPFQANALTQVFVTSGAQNTSGVSLNSYQSSFTTLPDTTTLVPTQIGSNPPNASVGVPTNVAIDIGFNAALDSTTLGPTTVLCYQNNVWFQSEVSLVNGGTVIQVVPRFALQPNTSISCTASTSLQGLNGVASQGGAVQFTTGNGPDVVAPTIVEVSPPNGSTNVGDNANIRLMFSKPINPLTVNANTIQLSGGGSTFVPDSISFSNSNQMVLLVPHAPLPDNTQITLTISGITDVAGNAVTPQTTQFRTAAGPDVVAPILLWTSPFEPNTNQVPTNVPLNAIVQIQVNEPIDPGTVSSTTFSITDSSRAAVDGTYSVSADGLNVTFVPSRPFIANHQYYVSPLSAGMTDLSGNVLSAAASTLVGNFTFTTGTTSNTTAPQVTGFSPANAATGIPINAQAVVGFNEPIDPAKLTGVTLTGPGGTVRVSQTVSNGNQTITLIPVLPLAGGAQYTINIAGVQDLSGNIIPAPASSTFTTGSSADLVAPMESSTTPTSYATGVSTNTTVQVQFSKAIDPLTVTPATFYMYPYSTYLLVPGTISISTDCRTATFTPSEPLDSETFYFVELTTGITDLEGQSLSGSTRFYFTTAQGSTSLAPYVATVTPGAGASVGATVTIDGTYFGTAQGSSLLTFNGTAGTITSWSDTKIQVTVPSGATTGPLAVTVNGLTSTVPVYQVLARPVVTSISPSSAPVGTVVTITGTSFGDSQDSVSVQFNANVYPAPFVIPISWTPTSITVAVPSTTATGGVTVVVDGYQNDGSPIFTVIPTPMIGALTPNSGVAGTPVLISGNSFGSSQGSSTLSFNGVPPASITSWGNNSIVATPPSNATTGPVTMVVNSVPSNSDQIFTVMNPAIGSLSPPSGAVGSTIRVTGSGLLTQGLTTQVIFNGVAGYITSSSTNSIMVQVPSNATTGPVTVVVGTVSSNGVGFIVEQPPSITSLSRNHGPFGDDGLISPIKINGSGFGATQSNSAVNFYGSNTSPIIQSWSDSAISISVPLDATTGPLTIQVGGLTATAPSLFYVNQVTRLTDSLGNQTNYTFEIQGGQWLTSNSAGPGCSTCTIRGNITNTPDPEGNILTTTDDLNNTTTYTYDSSNHMISASKPLNSSTTSATSYIYNSFGEVLTMTDPLGNVTTNTYDPHGNLLTVTAPQPNSNTSASVTQFQYDAKGELTQITDPLSHVTNLTYTPAGLVASITDAQQHVTSYQYDVRGNRTAVIDPINGASHPTTFTYDIMSRLTGITYPDGSTVGFGYDLRGRRTSAADQNNRTTYYTYDDADRLTAVTDPANNKTQYAYDTEDNLLSITDANGHITQFAYNGRGWVTQTTFPSTLVEGYTYDLVACRSEFITTDAAGGVGVLPLDGPSVGGVGVDIAAELAS